MDDHCFDSESVYHADAESGTPPPLRAFFVDVYDEDTDLPEHAYYGVACADGGGLAQAVSENSIHKLQDVKRFAERIGGVLVWV
ncbi:hypothetical protein HNR23_001801 [Nocardiopsis mwathae]|uniref:Uncharacterized protein n=1 Tax=Nocardiopsis mwathae TaxID=1472723 RepID=A0A7X0D5J3_9ACTN|nr:hypothetical protein [Nocardiopsis mwathae]MBB6171741.1 hypothetical protein [Nocardiopsis mwathae]